MKEGRIVIGIIMVFLAITGLVNAQDSTVYYLNEGQSITLMFENPTDQAMTIQVQNLGYPNSKVPLWISPNQIPPNSTVTVIVHYYVTNDGVQPGTYAVALYTPYQSYLLYLKKEGTQQTEDSSAELEKLYAEVLTLQKTIQSLTSMYEQRYNELFNQIQQLKNSQSADDKEIAQLEANLEKLNANIQAIQKQVDNLNTLVLDAQKLVQANDKKITTFETKLQQYDKLMLEYDKKISVIDAAMKQIDIEKWKTMDQRVTNLEAKTKAMEQSVAEAKTLASSSSSSAATLEARLRDVESKMNYILVGSLAGVVALAMIFTNGGFKRNSRNGGLPRRAPRQRDEGLVPVGVNPRKAKEARIEPQPQGKITLTEDELEQLLARAYFEGMMKGAEGEKEIEEEGGSEENGGSEG